MPEEPSAPEAGAGTSSPGALPDGFWAAEPYRVFFPLGLLASAFGVLIWPLFYGGYWSFPPQLQHPRIMIFGFGGAFLVGFLGTAWPRMLDAEPFRRREVLALGMIWAAAVGAYAAHRLPLGDELFGLFSLLFLILLGNRCRARRALPPAGFQVAFLGVLLAMVVAFFWAFLSRSPPPWLFFFSKLLVWQGMLLFPILGVGSFLFPRVLQSSPDGPQRVSDSQVSQAVWSAAGLVLVSFLLEAMGQVRVGNGLRLAALFWWSIRAVPSLWSRASSTRAWALQMALGSMAAVFLTRIVWTGSAMAVVHLLFLGGFGLAMLLSADRVTLGHAGAAPEASRKSPFWRWMVWLILLAAATRVSAGMKASLVVSHQIYAALLWALIVGGWSWRYARYWVRRSEA